MPSPSKEITKDYNNETVHTSVEDSRWRTRHQTVVCDAMSSAESWMNEPTEKNSDFFYYTEFCIYIEQLPPMYLWLSLQSHISGGQ